jgi:BlaI family transcriptional regulator, penicillinase repressor
MNHMNIPTAAELEILQVLWEQSPQTVRHINDQLSKQKGEVGYTTTLKIMQNMLDKGILTREIVDRVHLYSPSQAKEITQNQLLQGFVETTYRGSAASLVLQALGNAETTAEELQKIKELIKSIEGQ